MPGVPYFENFDSTPEGGIPPGWADSADSPFFVSTTTKSYTPPHSLGTVQTNEKKDRFTRTPEIMLGPTNPLGGTLSFYNNYVLTPDVAGFFLEYQRTDPNPDPDFIPFAASDFLMGGYNNFITQNPPILSPQVTNEPCWSGSTDQSINSGFVFTSVNLDSLIFGAQNFFIRFRLITNATTAPVEGNAVYIDNLMITGNGFVVCVHPDMKVTTHRNVIKMVKEIKPNDILYTGYEDQKRKFTKVLINYQNKEKSEVLARFQKDAIKPNVPNEDLLLTTGHTVIVDDKYIRPVFLLNGDTIKRVRQPTLTHTLVTNNGLPVLMNNMQVSTWKLQKWIDLQYKQGKSQPEAQLEEESE